MPRRFSLSFPLLEFVSAIVSMSSSLEYVHLVIVGSVGGHLMVDSQSTTARLLPLERVHSISQLSGDSGVWFARTKQSEKVGYSRQPVKADARNTAQWETADVAGDQPTMKYVGVDPSETSRNA